jgi:hypothetical protein
MHKIEISLNYIYYDRQIDIIEIIFVKYCLYKYSTINNLDAF